MFFFRVHQHLEKCEYLSYAVAPVDDACQFLLERAECARLNYTMRELAKRDQNEG